ncbi:hypothetical protein [Georgenia sp. SUBG003]|uniref:hypothetical protein n=1 Tax=Georgenia sp. SUBG003 TaxID=1497974 RepID=UPI0004D76FBC|nr:hypothetical protein DA06_22015 [Georgenia sp. SUBG003]
MPGAFTAPPTRYSTPVVAGMVYLSDAVPAWSLKVTAAGVTATSAGFGSAGSAFMSSVTSAGLRARS